MTSSLHFKTMAAALVAMAALAACDRNRDDLPTAANDPASGAMGTPNTETAGTTVSPSPDSTVQQNPTGAGGLSGPNGTTGTTGTLGGNGAVSGSGSMTGGGIGTDPSATGTGNTGTGTNGSSGTTGDMGTGTGTGTSTGSGSR
ncbi:MAG: hypothetical protein QM742_08585 [Aquabacterium sp.]